MLGLDYIDYLLKYLYYDETDLRSDDVFMLEVNK
jgi:hypothetical protein